MLGRDEGGDRRSGSWSASEAHHRVSNSFAFAAAMLVGEARSVPVASLPLERAAHQLTVFATLHRQLMAGDAATSNGAAHLGAILDRVAEACLSPQGIALRYTPEAVATSYDDCILLGLIATELTFNAAKHAFPEGGGTIRVTLAASDIGFDLTVSDDGCGFDPAVVQNGGSAFFRTLERAGAAQFEVRSSAAGTEISVSIRGK